MVNGASHQQPTVENEKVWPQGEERGLRLRHIGGCTIGKGSVAKEKRKGHRIRQRREWRSSFAAMAGGVCFQHPQLFYSWRIVIKGNEGIKGRCKYQLILRAVDVVPNPITVEARNSCFNYNWFWVVKLIFLWRPKHLHKTGKSRLTSSTACLGAVDAEPNIHLMC